MSEPTEHCKHCGKKLIQPPRGRRIYCSSKCRFAYWTINNRERMNANARAYRRRRYAEDGCWRDEGAKAKALKAWMLEIKSGPCGDCGRCFPICCMDFDHREGEIKSGNVGSMFAHHYSRELIEREIEKCDLVCANCHRIRTQKRRTGKQRRKNDS